MQINLSESDLKRGKKMLSFAKTLFPLNRTIMGPDIRKSFDYFIRENKEFKQYFFKTGKKVFDWEIPQEWSVKDAYIEHESGSRFAEFKKNNLHLMGYSEPVNKKISKENLQKKIFIHKEIQDAVPYVTSYYKKDWAFCMSQKDLEKMPKGEYRVFIDSKFTDGKLVLLEAKIPGKLKKEIFFSSYLCHPSMANNELSGPILVNELLNYVKNLKPNKYSYRFVLLPETIGTIAYLSKRFTELKSKILCGFNLSCVGDERSFSHISSRIGDNLADKALTASLMEINNSKFYNFFQRGSDERQYCAPGIDLPVCTFCKSKFGEYPEYHTSKDNFDLVTEKGLSESFKVMKNIIDSFELGLYPKINVLCEPQLGKRNLYPNTSNSKLENQAKLRMDLISCCDGKLSIFEISNKMNTNLEKIKNELVLLNKERLITFD